MSRSNPSRADAARSGRGGRSGCSLPVPWWRRARLLSARLWRTARLLSARLWRTARPLPARLWRAGAQTARLAIGIPDYDNYVDHIRRHHPGREPMERDAFFHERMLARYGKGRSRCC